MPILPTTAETIKDGVTSIVVILGGILALLKAVTTMVKDNNHRKLEEKRIDADTERRKMLDAVVYETLKSEVDILKEKVQKNEITEAAFQIALSKIEKSIDKMLDRMINAAHGESNHQ